jgi:hypothetical protein
VLISSAAFAAENDDGAWLIVSTTDTFKTDSGDSNWHYSLDAQARYFNLGSGINQYLLRPAIGWQTSSNIRVWVGYARIRARNSVGTTVDEDRFWQQLDWRAGRWNGGTLTMRARLEQRSLSSGDDVGLVLRFQTRYVRPMGEHGKTKLVIGIEPFVDLKNTDWGGDSGLAQNRSFIGMNWRLSSGLSLEAGYMHQYIWVDSGTDRVNHLGVLNFKVRL